jgi:hypothetical protein
MFDSTRFIAQVNIKGSLPEGRFTDQEILDIGYDCLLSEITPMVLECREEFLVTYVDTAIVANQAAYPIPSRALNGVLREVKKISGNNVIDLDKMIIDDITDLSTGSPIGFFISGNNINLYPTPSSAVDTLRLYYFIRPSKLVPTSECARITGIAGNDLSVTIPATWTTANTFDLVRGKAHFDVLGMDLAATTLSGGVITMTANVPTTLAIGDYITLADETCFPFLPPEAHTPLVQAVVTSCLESMGDPNGANAAAKTTMLMDKLKSVLKLRVQGECNLGIRLL